MVEVSRPVLERRVLPEWLYFPNEEEKEKTPWVGGLALDHPHVTLKYGFLVNAHVWEDEIREKLSDLLPERVLVKEVVCWKNSPNYSIIVGLIGKGFEEANQTLSRFPHIDTYPYNPHITLAYVKPEYSELALDTLNRDVWAQRLSVGRLIFGEDGSETFSIDASGVWSS